MDAHYDIVGGGAGGVAMAASLRRRKPDLEIAIVDPADVHYYQPGWTLVGGGVFESNQTVRTMASVIPRGTHWLKAAVAAFLPERNQVELDGGRRIGYRYLVVCPGLKLDWRAAEGTVLVRGPLAAKRAARQYRD
jgi:sulfide:quinone oxidoreductase